LEVPTCEDNSLLKALANCDSVKSPLSSLYQVKKEKKKKRKKEKGKEEEEEEEEEKEELGS
jgi:ribosomal protein L12E/L44/L45/RPP1/RPP2